MGLPLCGLIQIGCGRSELFFTRHRITAFAESRFANRECTVVQCLAVIKYR
jgi:hypothetical protein